MEQVAATDLDLLTRIMRAKQTLEHRTAVEKQAKADRKEAEAELDKCMGELAPHVQRRRDDLQLPRLDATFDTSLGDKKSENNDHEDDGA